ncbi:MBL fold metallo-hydrolase [candidate division KSB1 bacterium]|nr:MBL fold metallo-hydrolase [candidate division KSB1 bacterium]
MQISFMGGAQTVTGSKHLLSVNGKRLLVECGLFQGRRQESRERNQSFLFDPAKVDALLLTHAHIDHSGNIPNLVKQGFNGPIYATAATVDLAEVLLRDSAHLHEQDAYYVNKRHAEKDLPPIEPLYTQADVEEALPLMRGVDYGDPVPLDRGITATFLDAGHILGSASILFDIEENGRSFRLGITGDIGRANQPILRDPNRMRDLDVLLIECTYGSRLHPQSEDAAEELAKIIRRIYERKGRILIPAFAVGRTQTLVYMLHKLYNQNRIPDMPIYVDSPMALEATQIFRRHPECFDREMQRTFLRDRQDPFGFGRLKYVRNSEESKKLNDLGGPHIIISASGMAEGGRVLHHLMHTLDTPENLVLFVGYAAQHTLARKLMDGDKTVPIFGRPFNVDCEIQTLGHFSGHGDQHDLLEYAAYSPPDRLKSIFLIHGEAEGAKALTEKLTEKGYKDVRYPALGETIEIRV